MVGFSETIYSVAEGAAVDLEICVEIFSAGTISQNTPVQISTRDGTATGTTSGPLPCLPL